MGFFGSKKIYVSSTVQNMAGDEKDRPDYLKTTVIGNILADRERLSETLKNSYLKGPGMKLRSFFRWASTGSNYDDIGLPTAKVGYTKSFNASNIKNEIPKPSDRQVVVQTIESGIADYSYWAEQYILENAKSQFDTDWVADVNDDTSLITIVYEDQSVETFMPASMNRNSQYLYVGYMLAGSGEVIDDPDTTERVFEGPFIYIYEIGTGKPVLDNLIIEEQQSFDNEFYPFIPIRLENAFLSEENKPDVYELAKKAFSKAVDGNVDSVVESLEDLESLPDIDHVYAVFGVSVNVKENACRKYMYNFFRQLTSIQESNNADYDAWKIKMDAFQASIEEWFLWKQAQEDPTSPDYGAEEPTILEYPKAPESKLFVKNTGGVDPGYKVELVWKSISETSGTGLAKLGAKKGELWFTSLGSDSFSESLYYAGSLLDVLAKKIDHVRLYWQVDESSWVALDIIGMLHRNHIYKTKYVEITLKEGLDDIEDSGFIVPLHYPTFKEMTLVDSTQMSTACTFLVFNSYVVKKTGLLGSTFFKIFLVAVIIAVIVFVPTLAPGVIKAGIATGTAVGLTGTIALVVGIAANAIVGMIISSLIMKASVEVFGEKFGALIGAIISVVAISVGSGLISGGNLSTSIAQLGRVDSILALTNAAGQGIAGYVQAAVVEVGQKLEELQETYEDKFKEIEDLYAEVIGSGRGSLDPLAITNAGSTSSYVYESADAFLTRTLMTGTEVADFSISLLNNFAEWTTSTDLP